MALGQRAKGEGDGESSLLAKGVGAPHQAREDKTT